MVIKLEVFMGLGIIAYSKLKALSPHQIEFDENNYTKNGAVFYRNDDFPNHFMGLNDEAVYLTELGKTIKFCAGSYEYYNNWKNCLAKMAGYESAMDVWNNINEGPFVEIINFSDCEGTIGYIFAEKLYQDFIRFEIKARKYTTEIKDEYFLENYNSFKEAFKLASDNGAVIFC